jgi:hypothetical protein
MAYSQEGADEKNVLLHISRLGWFNTKYNKILDKESFTNQNLL